MAAESLTVNINDTDGNSLYSVTGLAPSETTVEVVDSHNNPLQIPLSGVMTVQGVPVGGTFDQPYTMTVVLLIET